MSVFDLTKGGASKMNFAAGGKGYVLNGEVDCAEQNLAIGDSAKVITLPPNILVLGVRATVETAEGAAGTIDVGNGSTADLWHDGLNANDGTVDVYAAASAGALLVTSADGVYVKAVTADLDAAKVKVQAVVMDLSE